MKRSMWNRPHCECCAVQCKAGCLKGFTPRVNHDDGSIPRRNIPSYHKYTLQHIPSLRREGALRLRRMNYPGQRLTICCNACSDRWITQIAAEANVTVIQKLIGSAWRVLGSLAQLVETCQSVIRRSAASVKLAVVCTYQTIRNKIKV
jgi:hypothetical protein